MKNPLKVSLPIIFAVSILLTVSFYTSCFSKDSNAESPEDQLILNETTKTWQIRVFETEQKENIRILYAFDEKNIYGIGYEKMSSTFFKSLDEGKSWKNLSSIEGFSVNNSFFTSAEQGFITVSKITNSADNNQNESRIMKTDDGGLSWKTLFSSTEIILNKLIFDSNGNGLVIGQKKTPDSQNTVSVILLSKDKGQNWKQILNASGTNSSNAANLNLENVVDALFSKSNEIVFLSGSGKIFKTADEGNAWNLVTQFIDKQPQTSINRFGEMENGNFWITGGTMSIEGKWSVIASKKADGWDQTTLNNYYFYDVKFLSDKEVLACGFLHNIPKSDGAGESYKGVIMYSTNGGKNWESLHESNTSQKFYSIFTISKNKILIFGEKGTGVVLNKLQSN